jgi:integrase
MNKSKTPRYKGKVGVLPNNGSLRLSLPRVLFGGKQRYLSLGLKDTPENREIAQLKAHEIELDIKLNRFDSTLGRYKPQSVFVQKKAKPITLTTLFEQFMEAKETTVELDTYRNGYKVMLSHLKKSPFTKVIPDTDQNGFAQGLFDWATANLTPDTAKRFLTKLNACMEWAIASRLVQLKESPFKGMASRAISRKASGAKRDINTFTLQQRSAIIKCFYNHPEYSYYALFVDFCFSTGCRPSEAMALENRNISTDYQQVTFTHALVNGKNGRERRKGLKTQEKRTIYTSQSVQAILREAVNRSPNRIIFPGVKGGWFGYRTFSQNWQVVLEELEIEYRTPYYMRHTFITLCLEAKINVKDIAKAVGNSPEIIYRHYAENQSRFVLPEL